MLVNVFSIQVKQYPSKSIYLFNPSHSLTGKMKLSRYFTMMLIAFSSALFYTKHVQPPHDHQPVPPKIQNNPKFFPFFKDALGVMDGTHINCTSSAADWQSARDHKGVLTQNCLAICSFDMKFLYIFSVWDGCYDFLSLFHFCHHLFHYIFPFSL